MESFTILRVRKINPSTPSELEYKISLFFPLFTHIRGRKIVYD